MTLGAPIGGGRFHDTLSAPGAGDIVIKGTRGNDVTFAAVQYYDGSTTVEKGAVLRLGSGKAGGDGGLYTKGSLYRVVNDGSLVVRNTSRALVLSRISGGGSFTQSGAATTTLTGSGVTYGGSTTVTKGTLALRGGATLAHSKAVRLTAAGARLDVGSAGLRVGTTLTGSGTVKGSVTNEGVVADGLTISGSYTQAAKGELVFRGRPLKVGGAVRLAGALDLSSLGAASGSARTITLLNHTGRAKTAGAFSGLKEGTTLKLGSTAYRITYRGGDGNDVALTAVAKSGSPTAGSGARPGAGAVSGSVAAAGASTDSVSTAAGTGLGFWPYAMAVGLLAGLMIPATRKVRGPGNGRRRGGRHSAQG